MLLLGRRWIVVSATVVDPAAPLTETAEPAGRPWPPFLAAFAPGKYVPVRAVRRSAHGNIGHNDIGSVAAERLALAHGVIYYSREIFFCLLIWLKCRLMKGVRTDFFCGESEKTFPAVFDVDVRRTRWMGTKMEKKYGAFFGAFIVGKRMSATLW